MANMLEASISLAYTQCVTHACEQAADANKGFLFLSEKLILEHFPQDGEQDLSREDPGDIEEWGHVRAAATAFMASASHLALTCQCG